MSTTVAIPISGQRERGRTAQDQMDALTHALVADLHAPRPMRFWTDMLCSAAIGWSAFGLAAARPLSPGMLGLCAIAGFALYRGVCFTHELAHLRRRAVRGFETAWNILFGVPLLLPSFTYVGVHKDHHSLSTYGTKADPEYLPFATSRRMMLAFGVQSAVLLPLLMMSRFLVLAPVGLVWPRFHHWLAAHASSFAMNPAYRRDVSPELERHIRRWEVVILAAWAVPLALMAIGKMPARILLIWVGVVIFISLLNTIRVLGAHEYESDGNPLTRHGQLQDSIDTPGGPWTELWAPVGLRYHALHHYLPGIPYHNLGEGYRRIVEGLPSSSSYGESTSPSLRRSLTTLYDKAKRARRAVR